MTDTLITIAATAIATTAVIFYLIPTVGDACDRRRWYIAVRKRRRQIRLCTQKSLTWHSRAKVARQIGNTRRLDKATTVAELWDERLTIVADSDNIDWLPPSWMPVLPTRRWDGPKKQPRPQLQRKARYAPRLDNVRS